MNRKQLNEQELADVIMRQIGEIQPVGETREDERRLNNLILLTKTIDCLLDEITWTAAESSRVEYSMRQIGEYATKWLEETINTIR